jgi:peptidoglycan/xylan/chitin deacetylase (PgdA/CDA1 family)
MATSGVTIAIPSEDHPLPRGRLLLPGARTAGRIVGRGSMLNGLSTTIADLRTELHALRGGYPDFVVRDIESLPAGDVPVFTFHTIEPEPFEAQLGHLQRNGYRTIDADALLRHLTGEEPAPPRAVMLTIDDGRKSIWTYGFPLLRRYGFKATVFLIPGYVPEGLAVDANLDDVWAGRIAADALGVRDPELMNWHEIRAMHASGVIDLQSHTRFHHRVPVDSSVAGFLSPRQRAHPFDLPVPSGCEGRLAAAGPAGSYGLPLFRAASLMRAQPRYHPEPAVLEACIARVQGEGGAAFWRSRGAGRELRRTYDTAVAAHGAGRFDTPDEIAAAVRDDVERSRLLVDDALGSATCRHLCYPYTEGSQAAVALSREAGFVSNFWGLVHGRRGNRRGDDPFHIARLKGDYVHRLPGDGRRSLPAIMTAKFRRRLTGGPIY